jgi:hypothetical protein
LPEQIGADEGRNVGQLHGEAVFAVCIGDTKAMGMPP